MIVSRPFYTVYTRPGPDELGAPMEYEKEDRGPRPLYRVVTVRIGESGLYDGDIPL